MSRSRRKLVLALLALSFLVFASSAVRAFRVSGNSDLPGFVDGDLVLVNRFAFGLPIPFTNRDLLAWSGPRRGDVVLFRVLPSSRPLFKTVIGLPGELVAIESGRVTISGRPFEYRPVGSDGAFRELGFGVDQMILLDPGVGGFGSARVPEGHYFLLGSNRGASKDSRSFGPIPRMDVLGRVAVNLSR